MDKYTKRVLLLVILMSIITTIILPAMSLIPKEKSTSWPLFLLLITVGPVEAILLILFFTLDTIRTKFPINIFIMLLHSILASVLTGIPFIGKDSKWVLIVMGSAVVLYILLILIGAALPIDLNRHYIAVLTYGITVSVVTLAVTISVSFGTGDEKLALEILSIGMTALVIPIGLMCAQSAFGRPQFRQFPYNYCAAAFFVHITLIFLLIYINIGLPYLISGRVLSDELNHLKMSF
uniref:Uncharacterized protein n=1 Tax=Trichobilharzia regenti TaxID=157069 RepID=A0AA85KLG4_TRIRE|nr:unnamed protein product [Trichobilharzia regenti]